MSNTSEKDLNNGQSVTSEDNANCSDSQSLLCRNEQNSTEAGLCNNLSNKIQLDDKSETHFQVMEDNEIFKFQNVNSLPEVDHTKKFSLAFNGNSKDSSFSNQQECEKNSEVTIVESSQSIMENVSLNNSFKNTFNNTTFQMLGRYFKGKNLNVYETIKSYLLNQEINGILSLNIKDTYLKSIIDDCIIEMSNLIAIDNTILPLVTLQAEIQNASSINKMIINEQSVSKLCNQMLKGKTFHKDPTAGNIINFSELNQKDFKIVALLGKTQNIFEFLQFHLKLTESELFSCYAKIHKTGSGIYLVSNLLTYLKCEKVGFLCLFSKNDSYYDEVNSKSKAIHFLRYMTLFSNNVVILPNVEDISCFPNLKSASAKTKRHSSYTLKQYQLQREECSIHEFGDLMLSFPKNDCKVFTSNTQGVLIANIKKLFKQHSYKRSFEMLTAPEFWEKYKHVQFEESDSIEFSFKERYLAFCKPENFGDKKKILAECEKCLQANQACSQFLDEVLLLLAQQCFALSFPLDFKLLKNCIETSKGDKLSFQNTIIEILSSFPQVAKTHLKEEMDKEYDHSLKTHLGIEALKYFNKYSEEAENLVKNHTLKELKIRRICTPRQSWYSYSRFSIYPAIMEFSKTEENMLILDVAIDNLIAFLKEFGKKYLLRDPDSKLFIKNAQEKFIKKHRDEKWRETVNRGFQEIKSQYSSNNTIIVTSISKSYSKDNVFSIRMQIKRDDEEKYIVDFYKLVQIKDAIFDNSSTISRRNHDILPIGTHEINGAKTIFHLYPCEANYIMLLVNFKSQSSLNIINVKNGKLIIEIPFGKPISLSSFDNNLRVLAIYSNCSNFNGFSFYKFSTDFKNYHKINQINIELIYAIGNINCIELQYQSKFLWILDSDSRICRIDYNTRNISMDKKFKPPKDIFHSLKIHPSGYCLFLFAENNHCYPIMLETYTVLPSIKLEPTSLISNISGFHSAVNLYCNLKILKFHKFKLTTAKSELQIRKDEEEKSEIISEKFHWLYYFYWMFVKFPCDDLLKLNQRQLKYSYLVNDTSVMKKDFENCLQNYMSRIKKTLIQTNKPLNFLGFINKVSIKNFHTFSLKEVEKYPVGDFIKELICLVPCQIARCQFSEFYVLNDGEQLNINESNDVFDLKDKISLGFFEAVFNSWDKEIKVLSSMGKQSTGKSYTLNHLTGSSYDISGSRCTDGCWLTLKVTEDCLYVVLDFEGLGSFERTDQDDMLLSLFNSAISNMTLFKTEYRLDKDVDQMFSRFNLGSSQMKDNEHLFQGRFFIIIKDVAEQDIDDVQREFEQKITTIITKESEKNFISKLYQSGFDILPFSMFQLEEYYHDMENLCNIMINDIRGTFHDGTSFLDFLKLLLAKLAINDFTSIGRQQMDGRIKYLKNCMKHALIYGQISSDVPKTEELDLKNLDDFSIEIVRKKSFFLSEISMTICLNDFDFIFLDDFLSEIVYKFSTIYSQGNNNNQQWRLGLEAFVNNALKFRFERVLNWIQLNTKKFKLQNNIEFEDICNGLEDYFIKLKDDLQNKFLFCSEICSKCFLRCTKLVNHYEDHCCSTEHECTDLCVFCDEFRENYCKYQMGHEGRHHCSKVNHMCGQPCKYIEINHCRNECQLESNHSEDHICSLSSHICNTKCSLPDCTSTCNINCDITHEIHKCVKEQCIKKCCIENCTNKCTVLDHFHGTELSNKFKTENNICDEEIFSELHFCGNEHKCNQLCAIDGYCKVTVEKSVVDAEFVGARGSFTYKRQFVQNGEKLNCLKNIKPFETKHDGDHICSNDTNKVHICMEVCPTCENICDKPHGHYSFGDHLHDTGHGNMVHCSFIANDDDFNVGSHKYKVGDSAVAEMCHMFCNSLGRGHIHVIECDKQNEKCVYDAKDDFRRHQSCKYEPNSNIEKDEIHHTKYWDTIGWKDPCTDISDFGKCPCFCSEEHESESFCIGELWHKPYKSLVDSGKSKGTIADGHLFLCEHDSHSFHFVLALDASWSMGGKHWSTLLDSVDAFVNFRLNLKPDDMISVIVYSSSSTIVTEYVELSCFSRDKLNFIGGGTCFKLALQDVDTVIQKHLSKSVTPILIFMSDGGSSDGDDEMTEIEKKYRDYKFKCYTVGFGRSDFDKLRTLASLGGGIFLECSTDIKLKNTFFEIAAKHPSMVSVVALK